MEQHQIPPRRGSVVGRAILAGAAVQVFDVLIDPEYELTEAARIGGIRTVLAVPLMREGIPIGVIVLQRKVVRPFTARQIGLVETFADQAVIAIENVRLCEAERGFIFRFDGELLRAAAAYNVGTEIKEFVYRNPIAPGRHSIAARAALERRTAHVPDVQADPDYAYAVRDKELIRTSLAVPMLKGDSLVGTIVIYRLEVRPFTGKQIELVETFADQAVIAIENARLFEEVQARTRDLSELLEQQTATSEILRVISASPSDIQPVVDTIARSALRLCTGHLSAVYRFDGDLIHCIAQHNWTAEGIEVLRRVYPRPPSRRDTGRQSHS